MNEETFIKSLRYVTELQNKFNNSINKNWKKDLFSEEIGMAIFDECSEIINCLGWKWWKKQEIDINNIKIEIIDLFHFILSYCIKKSDINFIDKIKNKKYFQTLFLSFKNNKILTKNTLTKENKIYISNILAIIISYVFNISTVNTEKYNLENTFAVLRLFFSLASLFMTYDELIKIYIGKNALNILRQDYGYKNGNYIKIWNKKQNLSDDYFLYKQLKQYTLENITLEKIYNDLKSIYIKITKN